MNIYIAGSFAGRHRIRQMAEKLKRPWFKVLSQWFKDEDFVEKAWDKDFHGRVAEAMAHRDLVGVLQADVFIIDTFEPSTTGGRYVEMGIALARQLQGHEVTVIQIGPASNIFENLIHERYETWEEFFSQWGLE